MSPNEMSTGRLSARRADSISACSVRVVPRSWPSGRLSTSRKEKSGSMALRIKYRMVLRPAP
eukprot:5294514-Alexandrium_andersonii.AAC.1